MKTSQNKQKELLISYSEGGIKNIKFNRVPIEYVDKKVKEGSDTLKEKIQQIRELNEKMNNTSDPSEKNEIKKQMDSLKLSLDYFSLCQFHNDERRNNNFLSTWGLLFDFDDVENVEEKRKEIEFDPLVYRCFLSPSGNGLKVIIRLKQSITEIDSYRRVYLYYMNELKNKFGINPDNTIDPSRSCSMSYDPDLYINDNSEFADINVSLPKLRNIKTATYEKRQSKYENLFSGVEEGNRNNALMELYGYLQRKGHSFQVIRKILSDWNQDNRPPIDEEEFEQKMDSCFSLYYSSEPNFLNLNEDDNSYNVNYL
jgi:hypothetical protein